MDGTLGIAEAQVALKSTLEAIKGAMRAAWQKACTREPPAMKVAH